MQRPNLFSFATSELSQDAALCWLLAWAHPEFRETYKHLHILAQQLLAWCFEQQGIQMPQIHSIHVKRQHHKIDILLTINDRYKLLIEDKTASVDHDNQLARYKELLVKQGVSLEDIIPVYIQTGEQSDYDRVKKASYAVLHRSELLRFLQTAVDAGCQNAILLDFYEQLTHLENAVRSYQTLPLAQWHGMSWQGFLGDVQQRLGKGNWNYVPTASGGFHGFWWHWHGSPGEVKYYLQLEHGRLCFKMQGGAKQDRLQLARTLGAKLIATGQQKKLNVSKPSRLQVGQTMTIAILANDYRAADAHGTIDMEKTIEALRQVEQVLTATMQPQVQVP